MKIIISPAKKLKESKRKIDFFTNIRFKAETMHLIDKLKALTAKDISLLMNISKNLAELNFNRFQSWNLNSKEVNHALFMFDGDVYKSLNVADLNDLDIKFASDNLRIVSGLYGLLRPLDLIYPYRLEMGTNLKTKDKDNLYDFWESKLHDSLKNELKNKETLINLASDEYSKALQLHKLNQKVIKPVFKDFKNGKFKVISFHAKKARGEMVNFIVKNKISKYQDLKLFKNCGYSFADELGENLVFTR
jgi:cytoplasmic iron level regulating protein YaaA (DUF328/UPF0246 family)